VALPTPLGVNRVDVETARDMLAACQAALPADVGVFVAAVADWRIDEVFGVKLKKDKGGPPALTFVENPDILATLSASGPGGRSWWSASRPRPTMSRPTPAPSWRARAATGSSPTTSPSRA
jgi:hypothetical protein